MKLNIECMRDILGFCIDNISYKQYQATWTIKGISLQELTNAFSNQYEQTEIMYSIVKLYECQYIIADIFPSNNIVIEKCIIKDVSYDGHVFYNAINNENIWNKIKDACKQFGIFSLKEIASIALSYGNTLAMQAIQQ